MAKTYAWSNISLPDGSTVAFGEEVTQSGLKVSKEAFEDMLYEGVVREKKPPDMEGFSGSPVEKLRSDIARESEGDVAYARSAGGSYFGPNEEDILMDQLGGDSGSS